MARLCCPCASGAVIDAIELESIRLLASHLVDLLSHAYYIEVIGINKKNMFHDDTKTRELTRLEIARACAPRFTYAHQTDIPPVLACAAINLLAWGLDQMALKALANA